MTTVKTFYGRGKHEINYHAEVPFDKKPSLILYQGSPLEKIVDGIKYYFSEEGKEYIAERFDNYFNPAI